MAVQIIENWSRIGGTVLRVEPAPDYATFVLAQVQVDSVEPVAGFANLLVDATGQTLPVLIPSNLVSRLGLRVGSRIRARVRRASLKRIFAHAEEVTVEPDRVEPR
jgi:hypothetical protein